MLPSSGTNQLVLLDKSHLILGYLSEKERQLNETVLRVPPSQNFSDFPDLSANYHGKQQKHLRLS